MAAGCPVVASRSASIPEVCDDAAAYFAPQDVAAMCDQVERVLGDTAYRNDLVRRGRENVTRYSWSKSVDLLLAHLRSIDED